jgi:15-cis-phytoene synthase
MVAADPLLDSLPAVQRVALAYAPQHSRAAWLGLLALDTRLAQLVRETREPMLGQIRLAWWRERLGEAPAKRPRGEPLLALLGQGSERLVPLVDAWESLLGEAPLPRETIAEFAEGRAQALAGLATALGRPEAARPGAQMGRRWALADLSLHVRHPQEREHVAALIAAEGRNRPRLPREMRPLVVLHGLAMRDLRRPRDKAGMGALLATLRLGIFGR